MEPTYDSSKVTIIWTFLCVWGTSNPGGNIHIPPDKSGTTIHVIFLAIRENKQRRWHAESEGRCQWEVLCSPYL